MRPAAATPRPCGGCWRGTPSLPASEPTSGRCVLSPGNVVFVALSCFPMCVSCYCYHHLRPSIIMTMLVLLFSLCLTLILLSLLSSSVVVFSIVFFFVVFFCCLTKSLDVQSYYSVFLSKISLPFFLLFLFLKSTIHAQHSASSG